jgi:hypothetical protein
MVLILAKLTLFIIASAQVAVPRVGSQASGKSNCKEAAAAGRLAAIPKRRPADQILTQLQQETEDAWRAQAPMPSGNV